VRGAAIFAGKNQLEPGASNKRLYLQDVGNEFFGGWRGIFFLIFFAAADVRLRVCFRTAPKHVWGTVFTRLWSGRFPA
jgi:hypothetical protein